ncbi:MAG: hypothetical protein QOH32_3677 [Bradyrhizobium sp.]|jgi:hypothetical protein|nr:hypothetical protein [Bradyrhizobium sp.]
MDTARHSSNAALTSLETAAANARSGFACTFSSSDEYERALISERRAQGRYARPRTNWPMVLFFACCVMMAGFVVLFS